MCPRQGNPFSLLRQRKGTKSSRSGSALTWRSQVTRAPKATPLTGRPRADCSAVLGLCRSGRTHYAACGRRVQTTARSQRTKALRAPAKPCAPRRLRRAPRAIRSFGFAEHPLSHLASHRAQAQRSALAPMRSEACLVFVFPFGRAEQHRALRGALQRASTTDFGRLFERSEQSEQSEFGPTRKVRAAQGSPRTARAEEAGVASLPPFLSIQVREAGICSLCAAKLCRYQRRSAAGTKPRRGLTQ